MDKSTLEKLRQEAETEFSALEKERQQLEQRHPQVIEAMTKLKARYDLLTEQIISIGAVKSNKKANTVDATEVDKDATR